METAMTDENGVTVEAHGPGGFWGKVSGADVKGLLMVIIILMGFGAIAYQNYEQANQAAENTRMFLTQHAVTQTLQKDIIANQGHIVKLMTTTQDEVKRALFVQTYVLSLDENQRKALRLEMPEELKYGSRRQ